MNTTESKFVTAKPQQKLVSEESPEMSESLKAYATMVDASIELDDTDNIYGGTFEHKHILWAKLFTVVRSGDTVRMVVANRIVIKSDDYYRQFFSAFRNALERDVRIEVLLLCNSQESEKRNIRKNLKVLENFNHGKKELLAVRIGGDISSNILECSDADLSTSVEFETFGNAGYRRSLYPTGSESICNFNDTVNVDNLIKAFQSAYSRAQPYPA